jgi:hypothetical protein
MTSRTFATLNANALGGGLLLSAGNLIVTTDTDNIDRNRKVLGTVPRGTGDAYFECYFYSDTRPDDLSETCSVGVATPDSALDQATGEDADSFGLIVGTGEITTHDSGSLFVNPLTERLCIGVLLRADLVAPTLAFSVNGSLLEEIALPAGKFWVPSLTVSGLPAGDMKAFVNFGQRGFDYPAVVVS